MSELLCLLPASKSMHEQAGFRAPRDAAVVGYPEKYPERSRRAELSVAAASAPYNASWRGVTGRFRGAP